MIAEAAREVTFPFCSFRRVFWRFSNSPGLNFISISSGEKKEQCGLSAPKIQSAFGTSSRHVSVKVVDLIAAFHFLQIGTFCADMCSFIIHLDYA